MPNSICFSSTPIDTASAHPGGGDLIKVGSWEVTVKLASRALQDIAGHLTCEAIDTPNHRFPFTIATGKKRATVLVPFVATDQACTLKLRSDTDGTSVVAPKVRTVHPRGVEARLRWKKAGDAARVYTPGMQDKPKLRVRLSYGLDTAASVTIEGASLKKGRLTFDLPAGSESVAVPADKIQIKKLSAATTENWTIVEPTDSSYGLLTGSESLSVKLGPDYTLSFDDPWITELQHYHVGDMVLVKVKLNQAADADRSFGTLTFPRSTDRGPWTVRDDFTPLQEVSGDNSVDLQFAENTSSLEVKLKLEIEGKPNFTLVPAAEVKKGAKTSRKLATKVLPRNRLFFEAGAIVPSWPVRHDETATVTVKLTHPVHLPKTGAVRVAYLTCPEAFSNRYRVKLKENDASAAIDVVFDKLDTLPPSTSHVDLKLEHRRAPMKCDLEIQELPGGTQLEAAALLEYGILRVPIVFKRRLRFADPTPIEDVLREDGATRHLKIGENKVHLRLKKKSGQKLVGYLACAAFDPGDNVSFEIPAGDLKLSVPVKFKRSHQPVPLELAVDGDDAEVYRDASLTVHPQLPQARLKWRDPTKANRLYAPSGSRRPKLDLVMSYAPLEEVRFQLLGDGLQTALTLTVKANEASLQIPEGLTTPADFAIKAKGLKKERNEEWELTAETPELALPGLLPDANDLTSKLIVHLAPDFTVSFAPDEAWISDQAKFFEGDEVEILVQLNRKSRSSSKLRAKLEYPSDTGKRTEDITIPSGKMEKKFSIPLTKHDLNSHFKLVPEDPCKPGKKVEHHLRVHQKNRLLFKSDPISPKGPYHQGDKAWVSVSLKRPCALPNGAARLELAQLACPGFSAPVPVSFNNGQSDARVEVTFDNLAGQRGHLEIKIETLGTCPLPVRVAALARTPLVTKNQKLEAGILRVAIDEKRRLDIAPSFGGHWYTGDTLRLELESSGDLADGASAGNLKSKLFSSTGGSGTSAITRNGGSDELFPVSVADTIQQTAFHPRKVDLVLEPPGTHSVRSQGKVKVDLLPYPQVRFADVAIDKPHGEVEKNGEVFVFNKQDTPRFRIQLVQGKRPPQAGLRFRLSSDGTPPAFDPPVEIDFTPDDFKRGAIKGVESITLNEVCGQDPLQPGVVIKLEAVDRCRNPDRPQQQQIKIKVGASTTLGFGEGANWLEPKRPKVTERGTVRLSLRGEAPTGGDVNLELKSPALTAPMPVTVPAGSWATGEFEIIDVPFDAPGQEISLVMATRLDCRLMEATSAGGVETVTRPLSMGKSTYVSLEADALGVVWTETPGPFFPGDTVVVRVNLVEPARAPNAPGSENLLKIEAGVRKVLVADLQCDAFVAPRPSTGTQTDPKGPVLAPVYVEEGRATARLSFKIAKTVTEHKEAPVILSQSKNRFYAPKKKQKFKLEVQPLPMLRFAAVQPQLGAQAPYVAAKDSSPTVRFEVDGPPPDRAPCRFQVSFEGFAGPGLVGRALELAQHFEVSFSRADYENGLVRDDHLAPRDKTVFFERQLGRLLRVPQQLLGTTTSPQLKIAPVVVVSPGGPPLPSVHPDFRVATGPSSRSTLDLTVATDSVFLPDDSWWILPDSWYDATNDDREVFTDPDEEQGAKGWLAFRPLQVVRGDACIVRVQRVGNLGTDILAGEFELSCPHFERSQGRAIRYPVVWQSGAEMSDAIPVTFAEKAHSLLPSTGGDKRKADVARTAVISVVKKPTATSPLLVSVGRASRSVQLFGFRHLSLAGEPLSVDDSTRYSDKKKKGKKRYRFLIGETIEVEVLLLPPPFAEVRALLLGHAVGQIAPLAGDPYILAPGIGDMEVVFKRGQCRQVASITPALPTVLVGADIEEDHQRLFLGLDQSAYPDVRMAKKGMELWKDSQGRSFSRSSIGGAGRVQTYLRVEIHLSGLGFDAERPLVLASESEEENLDGVFSRLEQAVFRLKLDPPPPAAVELKLVSPTFAADELVQIAAGETEKEVRVTLENHSLDPNDDPQPVQVEVVRQSGPCVVLNEKPFRNALSIKVRADPAVAFPLTFDKRTLEHLDSLSTDLEREAIAGPEWQRHHGPWIEPTGSRHVVGDKVRLHALSSLEAVAGQHVLVKSPVFDREWSLQFAQNDREASVEAVIAQKGKGLETVQLELPENAEGFRISHLKVQKLLVVEKRRVYFPPRACISPSGPFVRNDWVTLSLCLDPPAGLDGASCEITGPFPTQTCNFATGESFQEVSVQLKTESDAPQRIAVKRLEHCDVGKSDGFEVVVRKPEVKLAAEPVDPPERCHLGERATLWLELNTPAPCAEPWIPGSPVPDTTDELGYGCKVEVTGPCFVGAPYEACFAPGVSKMGVEVRFIGENPGVYEVQLQTPERCKLSQSQSVQIELKDAPRVFFSDPPLEGFGVDEVFTPGVQVPLRIELSEPPKRAFRVAIASQAFGSTVYHLQIPKPPKITVEQRLTPGYKAAKPIYTQIVTLASGVMAESDGVPLRRRKIFLTPEPGSRYLRGLDESYVLGLQVSSDTSKTSCAEVLHNGQSMHPQAVPETEDDLIDASSYCNLHRVLVVEYHGKRKAKKKTKGATQNTGSSPRTIRDTTASPHAALFVQGKPITDLLHGLQLGPNLLKRGPFQLVSNRQYAKAGDPPESDWILVSTPGNPPLLEVIASPVPAEPLDPTAIEPGSEPHLHQTHLSFQAKRDKFCKKLFREGTSVRQHPLLDVHHSRGKSLSGIPVGKHKKRKPLRPPVPNVRPNAASVDDPHVNGRQGMGLREDSFGSDQRLLGTQEDPGPHVVQPVRPGDLQQTPHTEAPSGPEQPGQDETTLPGYATLFTMTVEPPGQLWDLLEMAPPVPPEAEMFLVPMIPGTETLVADYQLLTGTAPEQSSEVDTGQGFDSSTMSLAGIPVTKLLELVSFPLQRPRIYDVRFRTCGRPNTTPTPPEQPKQPCEELALKLKVYPSSEFNIFFKYQIVPETLRAGVKGDFLGGTTSSSVDLTSDADRLEAREKERETFDASLDTMNSEQQVEALANREAHRELDMNHHRTQIESAVEQGGPIEQTRQSASRRGFAPTDEGQGTFQPNYAEIMPGKKVRRPEGGGSHGDVEAGGTHTRHIKHPQQSLVFHPLDPIALDPLEGEDPEARVEDNFTPLQETITAELETFMQFQAQQAEGILTDGLACVNETLNEAAVGIPSLVNNFVTGFSPTSAFFDSQAQQAQNLMLTLSRSAHADAAYQKILGSVQSLLDAVDSVGRVFSTLTSNFVPKFGWSLDFEMAFLQGRVALYWGWKEDLHGPLCFRWFRLEASLLLIAIHFQLDFGVRLSLAFLRFEVLIYLRLSLEAHLDTSFEREGPDTLLPEWCESWVKVIGKVEVGVNVVLIHENVLRFNAAVNTGIEFRWRFTPPFTFGKNVERPRPPGLDYELYWHGISFKVDFVVLGIPVVQRIVKLMKGNPEGVPWRRGSFPKSQSRSFWNAREYLKLAWNKLLYQRKRILKRLERWQKLQLDMAANPKQTLLRLGDTQSRWPLTTVLPSYAYRGKDDQDGKDYWDENKRRWDEQWQEVVEAFPHESRSVSGKGVRFVCSDPLGDKLDKLAKKIEKTWTKLYARLHALDGVAAQIEELQLEVDEAEELADKGEKGAKELASRARKLVRKSKALNWHVGTPAMQLRRLDKRIRSLRSYARLRQAW